MLAPPWKKDWTLLPQLVVETVLEMIVLLVLVAPLKTAWISPRGVPSTLGIRLTASASFLTNPVEMVTLWTTTVAKALPTFGMLGYGKSTATTGMLAVVVLLLAILTRTYSAPLMCTSGVATPGSFGPPVVHAVPAAPTKQLLAVMTLPSVLILR